ncbi:MAG: DUF192 domain-containing protein [Pseudomonadota bacterium]
MHGTWSWHKKALLAALGALAACSPRQADSRSATVTSAERRHPVSNLPVVPLTVSGPAGKRVFRVEVARTAAEQARGLMFRKAMGADEGMVFVRIPPDRASFWMRNTLIPLDIIFVGADGRILNIAANAVPHDETPLPSAGIAAAVLELNGGRADKLGIRPGDVVRW